MNHQLHDLKIFDGRKLIAFAVKTRNAPRFLSIATVPKNPHFSRSTTN
jgi:hypothetical protein